MNGIENQKNIESISNSIITSEKEYKEFIKMQNLNAKDIPYEGIYEYLTNICRNKKYLYQRPPEQVERIKHILNIFRVRKEGYKADENIQLNDNFYNSIISNIPEGLDKVTFSRAVYIELNKRVEYSPDMVFFNHDLRNKSVDRIYNKNIGNVTKEENQITCKGWAELYSYILQKNGIDSYVIKKAKHYKVQIITENEIIQADATVQLTSKHGTAIMDDLTRAKIGEEPVGFISKNRNFEGIDKKLGYDFKPIGLSQEVKKILDEFEDYDISNIEYEKILKSFKEIILNMIKESEDISSIERYVYIKTLLQKTGKAFNKNIDIKVFPVFKKELNAENRFKLITIIEIINKSTYKGPKYMIIDTGANILSKQEWKEQVMNGRYLTVQKNINKEKERNEGNEGNEY